MYCPSGHSQHLANNCKKNLANEWMKTPVCLLSCESAVLDVHFVVNDALKTAVCPSAAAA